MGFYNNNISDKRGMTPQCSAIYSALKVFPCIHFNQLGYFMPAYLSTHKNYEKTIANYLANEQFTYMRDNCIFTKDLNSPDESLIDTIWVAIDLFKDNPENISTALRTAFKPPYPCTAAVFKDNSVRYNLIPISSSMDFAKIHTENENYKTSENKDISFYIFVMRNLDLANEFAKTKPDFPYQIAYLTGDFGEYPTIQYYDIE